jgi:hypothetical protein
MARWGWRAATCLALCLPVLATFLYVRAFAVELPYADDWGLVIPQLPHLETGALTWEDINILHNESVVLVPQLAGLAAAKIVGYRAVVLIWISYSFLCSSLFVLFLLFRQLRLPGRCGALWFLPVSIFFMGWRQSEGLLWGAHLVNTMALFFSLLALHCCARAQCVRGFLAGAVVSAWAASYSMASGILIWPVGWIVLAVLGPTESSRARLWRVLGWTLAGAVCMACFILDRPIGPIGWRTGVIYAGSNLGAAVKYILTYLGSPFNHDPGLALRAGAVFAMVAGLTVYFTIREVPREAGVPAGLQLVLLVALALVPLVAFRLDLGAEEAVSSRYVTFGSLAPIGVYFCLLAMRPKIQAARYLLAAMAVLFALGAVDSCRSGLADGRENRAYEIDCAAVVRDFRRHAPEEISCVNPDPQGILSYIAYLESHHLSLFKR